MKIWMRFSFIWMVWDVCTGKRHWGDRCVETAVVIMGLFCGYDELSVVIASRATRARW